MTKQEAFDLIYKKFALQAYPTCYRKRTKEEMLKGWIFDVVEVHKFNAFGAVLGNSYFKELEKFSVSVDFLHFPEELKPFSDLAPFLQSIAWLEHRLILKRSTYEEFVQYLRNLAHENQLVIEEGPLPKNDNPIKEIV